MLLVAPLFYLEFDFKVFVLNNTSCQGHDFKQVVIISNPKNLVDIGAARFYLGVNLKVVFTTL